MKAESRRFGLFLLTGGFAALVNVAARVLFSEIMPYEAAIIAAYLVAMVTAYVLSRVLVFEASGRSVTEELLKFSLVNLVAIVQVWLVTMGMRNYVLPFLSWTLYPDLVAHMAGVASPIFTSYFGHKYFSFRPSKPPAAGDSP